MQTISNGEKSRYSFIGNGATGIDESSLKELTGVKIQKEGPGLRRYEISFHADSIMKIPQVFIRDQADLIGYYAAIKRDGLYYWYSSNKNWYTLSELSNIKFVKRHLFSVNRKIRFENLREDEEVYFFAQWRDSSTKKKIRGGYHIFRYPVMAHALGAYKGQRYTNTREALEQSYAAGYHYLEADVNVTEDKHLVLSHGWDKEACKVTGMEYKPEFEHMTRDLFLQQTIKGAHTLAIEDLRDFMVKHEDTFFEIDLHRTDMKTKIPLLVEAFNNDESLMNRLLIQAETRKILEEIDSIHHFANYQVLYGPKWYNMMEVGIAFGLDHGVETIGIRYMNWKEEAAQLFHEAGFNTMAYTLKDDVTVANKLLKMGIDTICTDFVKSDDINK